MKFFEKRRREAERERKPPPQPIEILVEMVQHVNDIKDLDPTCPSEALADMGERFARTFR